MIRLKKYLGIALLVIAVNTTAQDFSFEATVNKTTVGSNESLKLTFTLTNAKATSKIALPSMGSEWQLTGGPSTQNSVNIVNGQMSSAYSETYYFKPLKLGQLTIGEATVQTDKGKLASNPISVTVVQGASSPQTQQPNVPPQPNQKAGGDFFVEVQLNKSKVYVGEPVLATFLFYSIDEPRQIEKADYPKLNGCWSEDIDTPVDVKTTVVNGRRYYTAVVKRQLLFPQVSGKIEVDGFNLQMIVSTGGSFFFRQNARVSDSAPAVNLNVLPYPDGKPGNLVGTFDPLSMNVTADKTELKANEAINLRVTFTGKGNLKLLDELPFEFPSDFEVFDPKTKDNISVSAGGESGSRTFEYILIPRVPGDFEIPSKNISFFDPGSKSYKTLSSPSLQFHVEKGADSGGNYVYDSRTDVQLLSQDIRFIKSAPEKWNRRGTIFLGTLPFYGLLALPVLMFLVVLGIRRKKDLEESDVKGTQRKKAGRVAKKHLAASSALLAKKELNSFYQELSAGMNKYLSHKLSIPLAELNKARIRELLSPYFEEAQLRKWMDVLENVEFARFSGNTGTQPTELLHQCSSMIEELEKKMN